MKKSISVVLDFFFLQNAPFNRLYNCPPSGSKLHWLCVQFQESFKEKKKKEAYYPLGGLAPNFRNHYYYNKPQKWIFKKLIYLISINVYYEY